jgi:hypothetical protein
MDIHTLTTTPMNLKDWLTVSTMWVAGAFLVMAFLTFMGVVFRYAAFFFCIGYGC